MENTFLLEVGLEEMPAHVVTPSIKELVNKISKYLKDERINFNNIKPFSTPRRLAVEISGLSDKQEDIDEEVKGPSKKIAVDENGNWSKAAIGFCKGQGVNPDDIQFKEIKGTEYVFVNKHITGKSVEEILVGLKDVITSMKFPTMMKWGNNSLEFVRPIKWLIALLNDKIIPFSILDVSTNNLSRGHRFLGQMAVINNANEYEEKLNDEFVIVDADQRKQKIREQINEISVENNWNIEIDEELLEEVNNLVEWPTAFYGNFDEKFLKIPKVVLITSMKNHQRFFSVENKNNEILPYFISVRNGNDHAIKNVANGNEKVLTARLSDAEFFYEEDQKKTIDDYLEKLKSVSFHDQISSEFDKMKRTKIIADLIANKLSLGNDDLVNLNRASDIYKFDLVTGMVGEFSELQGVMGEIYALLNGENAAVAKAIKEHYYPISANAELPDSKIGAILSIADKLDSVMTFFAAGMIPSGSNDPYALRRQVAGIVRILDNQNWNLDLNELMKESIDEEIRNSISPKVDQTKVIVDVNEFIKERIKKLLKDEKIRYDISEAAVNSMNFDVNYKMKIARKFNEIKNDDKFKETVEALTRVVRIADKNKVENLEINSSLFENDAENNLYNQSKTVDDSLNQLDANTSFDKISTLKESIISYFDATMIMDNNEEVKNNRLKQMNYLANIINRVIFVDSINIK
ncbi:glycine--tRNA ligase subunit beta [Lactobacillus sp. S2-2]|uniref:glycine--tRNA ligase subunit beta n=1 Tax=Lactobacillus sp. S2-2 TaxID=2692917 RepID=UPI001F02CE60|nr:glycine--tRNA ligase subunit beta [Lactobacillus sp. S2-2]MCF6514989.1 glycine--tRNA ligase subunit beta [Lactobacillus sp. S2-2]